jgi:beta-phosphoglucomutase-like phosphatase (HAD superfamily)
MSEQRGAKSALAIEAAFLGGNRMEVEDAPCGIRAARARGMAALGIARLHDAACCGVRVPTSC